MKRPLLIVFSPIYGLITWMRNRLFDIGILDSRSFPIPVISVGNLNVGGTGKTPHIMYLAGMLLERDQVAVLSRGYGRDSQGFQMASDPLDPKVIGDEPAEIKARFSDLIVAVDEKRAHGIDRLQSIFPNLRAILLDDAFQHRYVKPGLSILLTDYNDLYSEDYLLPGGNLRESAAGRKRADLIVVTKCPLNLDKQKMHQTTEKLGLHPHQKIFFTGLTYRHPVKPNGEECTLPDRFLMVTGIANPGYLIEYLKSKNRTFEHLKFDDHHAFNQMDYLKMKKACQSLDVRCILTTTKDFMRFNLWQDELEGIEVYQLPVNVKFLEKEDEFRTIVKDFIAN